ncbi:MAG: nuoC [Dehalococcoidia bacterium]|nr:nuoC [Dehalococcoidia bacterium]
MTTALEARKVAQQLAGHLHGISCEADKNILWVDRESLFSVAQLLKTLPGLEFDYLNNLTAVDRFDYFEVVYHLSSVKHNHSLVLKTKCFGRDNPSVPSVFSLWRGADYQEREVYDLLGVTFSGHPNLKRILLWDGFDGHPLRRDYL